MLDKFHVHCGLYVNSLEFHSKHDTLVAGTVAGDLRLYSLKESSNKAELVWISYGTHSKSVRKAGFAKNGRSIVSVSTDGKVCITDVTSRRVKWQGTGHKDGINTFCLVDSHTIATGGEDGQMRVWDTRAGKSSCISKIREFEGTISAMSIGKNAKELLAISDDQLGCFDLRNGKVSLQGMSDNVEDELQCFTFIRNRSKLVCGTNTGNLCLFSYGHWGDLNDRINLHQNSIESLVSYDDSTVLAGGDDGKIHLVTCLPNEVKGEINIGRKLNLSISHTDSLCLSPSGNYLAFVADFEHLCAIPASEIASSQSGDNGDNFFGDIEGDNPTK